MKKVVCFLTLLFLAGCGTPAGELAGQAVGSTSFQSPGAPGDAFGEIPGFGSFVGTPLGD